METLKKEWLTPERSTSHLFFSGVMVVISGCLLRKSYAHHQLKKMANPKNMILVLSNINRSIATNSNVTVPENSIALFRPFKSFLPRRPGYAGLSYSTLAEEVKEAEKELTSLGELVRSFKCGVPFRQQFISTIWDRDLSTSNETPTYGSVLRLVKETREQWQMNEKMKRDDAKLKYDLLYKRTIKSNAAANSEFSTCVNMLDVVSTVSKLVDARKDARSMVRRSKISAGIAMFGSVFAFIGSVGQGIQTINSLTTTNDEKRGSVFLHGAAAYGLYKVSESFDKDVDRYIEEAWTNEVKKENIEKEISGLLGRHPLMAMIPGYSRQFAGRHSMISNAHDQLRERIDAIIVEEIGRFDL